MGKRDTGLFVLLFCKYQLLQNKIFTNKPDVVILGTFYKWEKECLEQPENLPQITQLVRSGYQPNVWVGGESEAAIGLLSMLEFPQ